MADEKFDEKALEKQEEKTEEKKWEEKGRRDPVSAIIWAIILIWAGLVLLADNLGILARWLTSLATATRLDFINRLETWAVILVGAGIILLIETLVRLGLPEYRRPLGGTIFLAIVLIGVGLGNEIGWTLIFPLILIALGLSILVRGLLRTR